jgi:abortive infection bacteriophage resistance protein
MILVIRLMFLPRTGPLLFGVEHILKPFKTYRQQLTILRSRGLSVNGSRAIRILEKENYYNVINGYKDLFLIQNGNIAIPERFISGASFDEIYKL